MKRLNKENINRAISQFDILNDFLRPYHSHKTLKAGQLISNPFLLPKKQKTPSFNIYKNKKGHWRYYDFATGDYGDGFDLVMKLNKCDFKNALIIINEQLRLALN